MKLKNVFELLGFRGRAKRYLYRVEKFNLQGGMAAKYARWLHPKEFTGPIADNRATVPVTDHHVAAYREILRPGDFCVDIGAHSGDSTLPIAIAVGTTGCTLALEPNPFVYHVLQKNARANRGIANIETLMAAAAPSERFMQFEYSDSGFCNGGRHEGISSLSHGHAYKLDVFGVNLAKELREDYGDRLPRLRLVKVDTEGFDLYVLQSILDIIREFRPYVKAEVFKNTSTAYRKELFSLFLDNNYSIYHIEDEPIGRGVLLGLKDVDSWRQFDILCVPGESVERR
jgi:FkbM family methyltransferase